LKSQNFDHKINEQVCKQWPLVANIAVSQLVYHSIPTGRLFQPDDQLCIGRQIRETLFYLLVYFYSDT
jgi:hypothetical protein